MVLYQEQQNHVLSLKNKQKTKNPNYKAPLKNKQTHKQSNKQTKKWFNPCITWLFWVEADLNIVL